MASPFRLNKKARKRVRKGAKRSASIVAMLEEKNLPEIAAIAKRSAELRLKMAESRRKKRPTKPGTQI